jgi:hypothetical protein
MDTSSFFPSLTSPSLAFLQSHRCLPGQGMRRPSPSVGSCARRLRLVDRARLRATAGARRPDNTAACSPAGYACVPRLGLTGRACLRAAAGAAQLLRSDGPELACARPPGWGCQSSPPWRNSTELGWARPPGRGAPFPPARTAALAQTEAETEQRAVADGRLDRVTSGDGREVGQSNERRRTRGWTE